MSGLIRQQQKDHKHTQQMIAHPIRTLCHAREHLRNLARYDKIYTAPADDLIKMCLHLVRIKDDKHGFRVDFLVQRTQLYAPYTSTKIPLGREMADSLGRYLKRQGSPGRIVELPGERVVETWTGCTCDRPDKKCPLHDTEFDESELS